MELLRGSWSFNGKGKGERPPATLGLPFHPKCHHTLRYLPWYYAQGIVYFSPPQLRVHTRWLQLPSKRGNDIAAALWLGPLCFLSAALLPQKPLVLCQSPALQKHQPAVSLWSALNSTSKRDQATHPPSLPTCYHLSTTKPEDSRGWQASGP